MIIRKTDIRQRHIRKIPIRMKMVLRRYMHGRGRYGNEYPDQNVQEDTQDGAEAGYPEEHYGIAVGAEEPYEDEGAHPRLP